MPTGYAKRNMPAFDSSRVIFSTHGIQHLHHLGDFYNELYTRKPEQVFSIKIDAEICTSVGVGPVMINANQVRYGSTPPIMLDIKLGDIPRVVAMAAKALGDVHQPVAFTVNPSSGVKSLKAAVENRGDCKVVVATVNTSLSDEDCLRIYSRTRAQQVRIFAEMAAEAGADAIIVGGWECGTVKDLPLEIYGAGIRPHWYGDTGDNTQTVTPTEAVAGGANKIIIGGPVLLPPPPYTRREAALMIIKEVNDATNQLRKHQLVQV